MPDTTTDVKAVKMEMPSAFTMDELSPESRESTIF
jgi:hypothetical protein